MTSRTEAIKRIKRVMSDHHGERRLQRGRVTDAVRGARIRDVSIRCSRPGQNSNVVAF